VNKVYQPIKLFSFASEDKAICIWRQSHRTTPESVSCYHWL